MCFKRMVANVRDCVKTRLLLLKVQFVRGCVKTDHYPVGSTVCLVNYPKLGPKKTQTTKA